MGKPRLTQSELLSIFDASPVGQPFREVVRHVAELAEDRRALEFAHLFVGHDLERRRIGHTSSLPILPRRSFLYIDVGEAA